MERYKVGGYYSLVEEHYGPEILDKFKASLPDGEATIEHTEFINALDTILSGVTPIRPSFRRTSPCCAEDGEFRFS